MAVWRLNFAGVGWIRREVIHHKRSVQGCLAPVSIKLFGYAYWVWRWFGMAVCLRETVLRCTRP